MKLIKPILMVLALLLAAVAGFLLGRATAPGDKSVTFYATIDELRDTGMTVTGLPVNDINTRGAFSLTVKEDTVLEWRHTPMTLAEFDVGDTIAVTYTGYVLETYPARLETVLKIQLLDDVK